MTYDEFIQNILDTRGRFNVPDGEYHERHHIKPKCLSGNNNTDNLIDLYAKEHYEAHKLLALENPHVSSLQFAWWNMSQCKGSTKERMELSPDEFEQVRKNASICFSGKNNPFYGKTHSEETKEKLRSSHIGKDFLSKEARERVSQINSIRMRGEGNPMYGKSVMAGKHHSDESKKKMREAKLGKKMSEDAKQKMSEIRREKAKNVVQMTKDGEVVAVYDSLISAHEATGILSQNISACCRGVGYHKSAGGYIWRFLDET